MSIPGNANPLLLASAAADAAAAGPIKSLRFNSDDSTSLSKTFSSAGNRKTWTWSAWVKRSGLGDYNFLFHAQTSSSLKAALSFWNSDILKFKTDSSGGEYTVDTDAVFRDPSAWYHIVLRFDTTQSTAADRIRIYVNGVQQTSSSGTYPNQNTDHEVNNSCEHLLGSQSGAASNGLDGYMTNVYFIDGVSLDPTSFGAYDDNGVWQAAEYSGTFGTNGFHLLDFANESTVGHDSSGNENDFTANNISTTAGVGNDVLFDVPTNGTQSDTGAGGEVSGNYPTLNPSFGPSTTTLSNGNLEYTNSARNLARSTIATPQSGKWYFEAEVTGETTGGGDHGVGLILASESDSTAGYVGQLSTAYGYYGDGNKYNNGSGSSYGSSFGPGDIIGCAFDADGGNLYFYKNGVAQNSGTAAFTGLTDEYFFAIENGTGGTMAVNFGARSFAYSAPSGYKTLCTTNFPTPTIADGSAYFDAVTYTSDGQASKKLTFGFSPDFFWSKVRNFAEHHVLHDSVRGPSKVLKSSSDAAESTEASGRGVLSFDSDGVTIGIGSPYNSSGNNSVVWAWDAGSSTASNTDGSITTSVRANQTAGFSIVSFTAGSSGSYGHGLNAEPFAVIFKNRDTAGKWRFYHKDVGTSNTLFLNTTEAATSSSERVTAVSSSTFTAGGTISGDDHIAYCFAPVAGYSAFGSWEGNLSTNGPFIYTGFKVAFLLMKSADTGYDWFVYDTTRQTFNVYGPNIRANRNYAEQDDDRFDLLSNGFKVRTKSVANNASSTTYIYAAFAENPFQANGGLAR